MGGQRGGVWAWWAAAAWAALVITPTLAEWDQDCPPGCKCTYASNRKLADCRHAGFSTVPTTLSTEVQELNLANNNIMFLEKDAFKRAGLVNLQKLYLNKNNVRSVHKDAFRDLRIMIELDLSGNRIDKLHPYTFTGLEKLRVLDLSTNQLARLDGVQFPPLPHLRKLDLRENALAYVHNFAFSNLAILNSLRLSGNRLQLIQPQLFLNNTKLVELELHDNLWECDCRLKDLVNWVKSRALLQTHVTCSSPERVSGRKWETLSDVELACRPELIVPQSQIPVALGQNASMTCRASGDPLPQLKWVLHGRVLTNMSIIPFSHPEQRYMVKEIVEGKDRWTQLTVPLVTDHDLTYYTCVADNLAGLVEQNVSLIPAAPTLPGAVSPKTGLELYVIISIALGGLLLLILIFLLICCCLKKRRHHESKLRPKVNGVAGGNHIEHKNVMIVNPVEKPPRKYEKVPQIDFELTALSPDPGAHRSYDEVDYPEAGPASHRSPLATLEEEDDDLPSQDTTLPLDSTATPSQCVLADYAAHYPDLLDMTRPRAVSPTQLSYHSLVAPQFTTPGEWRYSYVTPTELSHYPAAYVPPHQVQPRPGYVTLPRRHRSPSWAGTSMVEPDTASSPPPASEDGKLVRFDPIYDTLGPRTTADGTSRTDLTRPALRAAEPFTPHTPQSPSSPPSLPPYYTPISQSAHPGRLHSRNQSATLPRSTPNLLEGSSLSLPQHEVPSSHLTTRAARLAAHSPTPSNASTVRTGSPAYRTASPIVSVSQNHSPHRPSTKTPLGSSNESTLDSSQHNNNNNTISGKGDLNASEMSVGSSGGPGIVGNSGKKVPPKPPPKPSGKRLSVSSAGSDSRKGSLAGDNARVFQDEGPDGTEV
ncbi:uncharacterized protein [Cherax quadricarinatus]